MSARLMLDPDKKAPVLLKLSSMCFRAAVSGASSFGLKMHGRSEDSSQSSHLLTASGFKEFSPERIEQDDQEEFCSRHDIDSSRTEQQLRNDIGLRIDVITISISDCICRERIRGAFRSDCCHIGQESQLHRFLGESSSYQGLQGLCITLSREESGHQKEV